MFDPCVRKRNRTPVDLTFKRCPNTRSVAVQDEFFQAALRALPFVILGALVGSGMADPAQRRAYPWSSAEALGLAVLELEERQRPLSAVPSRRKLTKKGLGVGGAPVGTDDGAVIAFVFIRHWVDCLLVEAWF